MTDHEKQQRTTRFNKRQRRKELGLDPLTRGERLEAAMRPAVAAGMTVEQINELIWASVDAFRSGVAIHSSELDIRLAKLMTDKVKLATAAVVFCWQCEYELILVGGRCIICGTEQ